MLYRIFPFFFIIHGQNAGILVHFDQSHGGDAMTFVPAGKHCHVGAGTARVLGDSNNLQRKTASSQCGSGTAEFLVAV